MRTLIYKRTHNGDPDPATGEFGNHDCMGQVRGRDFDGVIGIGGIGQEAKRNRIARKLTWVGIGPHKSGDSSGLRVTFDHFRYYGEEGPFLETVAPALARRMYGGNVRLILDASLSAKGRLEVEKIIATAGTAPPSPARLPDVHRKVRQKKNGGCR
jgi:hypothetical protein